MIRSNSSSLSSRVAGEEEEEENSMTHHHLLRRRLRLVRPGSAAAAPTLPAAATLRLREAECNAAEAAAPEHPSSVEAEAGGAAAVRLEEEVH